MKSLRLVIAAAAASLFAFAALAQGSQTPPAQSSEGYSGCSSKNRPAATS